MKAFPLALLLLTCLTGGPALADPGDILRPRELQWASRPNGEDLEAVYPRKARRELRGGWAVIVCAAMPNGALTDCRVGAESEDGFGDAVLKVQSKFRLKPQLVDGRPVAGGFIQLPMVFKHPNTGSPPATFHPGSPAMLVRALPQGAGDGPSRFSCPSKADPARKCQTHPLEWVRSPIAIEVSELAARAGTGASLVECVVGESGTLASCKVGGDASPDIDADLLKLTEAYQAPPRTLDGEKTAGERVLLTFDWKVLGAIAAAYQSVKAAQQVP